MRAGLRCDVDLHRFRLWRWAVGAVAFAAVVSLGAWWWARPADAAITVLIAAGLMMVAALLAALSVARIESGRLRLEGGVWTFLPAGPHVADAIVGDLEVAIDLGSFMLLRFVAAGTPRGGRARWLPAERAGLEHDWHALRCAVYSPRLAAAGVADAANPHPSE